MDSEYGALGVIGAITAGLIVLVVWAGVRDEKRFAAYRAEHGCVEAGYIEGHLSTGYGVTGNGKMGVVTTSTPRKTRWVCDNGAVEIFR